MTDEEVQIPLEYLERIDRLIKHTQSKYRTRDEFIMSAIELRLAELDSAFEGEPTDE